MSDGFIGEYYHTIDAKGRVIIPQRFRDELGEHFILSRGLDGCLWIQPQDEWDDFRSKLRKLSTIDKKSRNFKRFFTAGATPCELDKQGRILVPPTLREFAGLEKNVMLAGQLGRIDIWDEEKWWAICEDDMNAIAEGMDDMDIII